MKNLLLPFCCILLFALTHILSGQVYAGKQTPVSAEVDNSPMNKAIKASLFMTPDSTQKNSKETQKNPNNSPFQKLNIKVYPNPGNGLFTVEMNNKKPMGFRFKVYNLTGKEVLTEVNRPVTACKTTLNLTSFSDGIYLLSIQTGEHKKVIKLLKQ